MSTDGQTGFLCMLVQICRGCITHISWVWTHLTPLCFSRVSQKLCPATNGKPPSRSPSPWAPTWSALLCTSLTLWKKCPTEEFQCVSVIPSFKNVPLTVLDVNLFFAAEDLCTAEPDSNRRVRCKHHQGHLWLLWGVLQHVLLHLQTGYGHYQMVTKCDQFKSTAVKHVRRIMGNAWRSIIWMKSCD